MTKKQKKVLIRIIVSAVLLAAIMITTKLVEINKWIQQGIEYFRGNPEAYSYFMGSGNSMIHMYKFDEDKEYYVVVSKDYESGEIEFEEDDYA